SLGFVANGTLHRGEYNVHAGDGGRADNGAAGSAGGSISNSRILAVDAAATIATLEVFAGNGSAGAAGGSLTGNTIVVNSEIGYDTASGREGEVQILAGNGGNSSRLAGSGGSIINNTIRFSSTVDVKNNQNVNILAGDGGHLIGSSGGISAGNGGTITNLA